MSTRKYGDTATCACGLQVTYIGNRTWMDATGSPTHPGRRGWVHHLPAPSIAHQAAEASR